ncbi:hypothetical protein ACFVZD_00460 [Streptomyces sp. NPDC058287]|uniref:hypothetical protein n=1 Tax=unclassified Streptomyces TaxID=2593676 RepID=UPI0036E2AC87
MTRTGRPGSQQRIVADSAIVPRSEGDATMVIDGTLADSPMDDWGSQPAERKVSTAAVIVPKA